jgi:hypothetical protein
MNPISKPISYNYEVVKHYVVVKLDRLLSQPLLEFRKYFESRAQLSRTVGSTTA